MSIIASSKARDGVKSHNVAKAGALPDYTVYVLTRKQYALSATAGCSVCFAGAYLFYHSAIVGILLSAAGLFFPRFWRKELLLRRRARLRLQFKEALFSLSSSLAAGRSVENAFTAVLEDLQLIYPDPSSDILREFGFIRARMENGEPIEQSLRLFSDRASMDDIAQFADVLTIAKRSGGDLIEIIRRTSQVIGDKLEVQQEIAVMIAQKRLEARIMMAVPFVFMAFLTFAAPDYLAPLYQGVGYVILTAALVLLAGCYWLIHKMMAINI